MRTVSMALGGMGIAVLVGDASFEKSSLERRCSNLKGGGVRIAGFGSFSGLSMSISSSFGCDCVEESASSSESGRVSLKRYSKSQASPSPISPFRPPPRSSDCHSTLLLFGRLSHALTLMRRCSSSQSAPASVAIKSVGNHGCPRSKATCFVSFIPANRGLAPDRSGQWTKLYQKGMMHFQGARSVQVPWICVPEPGRVARRRMGMGGS